MTTGTLINVHLESIEAMLQRVTEDFAGHVEFEGGDAAVVASGQEIITQTKKRLAALRQEVEQIVLSPKWSDAHKVTLVAEAVAQAYKDLQSVKQAETTKADAASQAKHQLTATPKAKVDPTTDVFLNIEIRQRLAQMDVAPRMKIVAQAMTDGDTQIIRAIELDPLRASLIEASYLKRLKEEFAQQTQAQAWQRLKSLELVADRLRSIVVALDLSFQNYGTIPAFQGKPTTTTDLKMQNPQAPPPKGPADQAPAVTSQFQ